MTASTGIITTLAGSTTSGSYSGDNGPATSAALNFPTGISLDSVGISSFYRRSIYFFIYTLSLHLGNVYIADLYNHRIRKVTVSTGIINTIAGSGTSSYSGDGGAATSAELNYPFGVALDSTGAPTFTN